MNKIPVFLFEEHNEAFFVWHYSRINEIIQPINNTLLHVDEHSDFSIPLFHRSINTLENSLQRIYDFTFHELSIGNFIVPALYQKIFNRVEWLYQSNNEGKADEQFFAVYSHKGNGKIIQIKDKQKVEPLLFLGAEYKSFSFKTLQASGQFISSQSVVLDIDLDYFSCNPINYHYNGKVEITLDEFNAFNSNKHHFLRLSQGSHIKSIVEGSKYYLMFTCPELDGVNSKLKVSDDEIVRRINQLIEFLRRNQVQPSLIDICRSRLSGFTPEKQCDFIERNLLEGLANLYSLEINHVEDIYKQENISLNCVTTC